MESKKVTLEKTIQLFDNGCLEFTTNIFNKKPFKKAHSSTSTIVDDIIERISKNIKYELNQQLSEIEDIEKPISIKVSYDCYLHQ